MSTYFAGNYDVAVIGAGHAGIEAALASARLGCKTVMFTVTLDWIGNMPCNPSIGGSAKGHLVFEIDALGGEKGVGDGKLVIDLIVGIGIQYTVNGSFGNTQIFETLCFCHGEDILSAICFFFSITDFRKNCKGF
mgnify:CR=1 FL=1